MEVITRHKKVIIIAGIAAAALLTVFLSAAVLRDVKKEDNSESQRPARKKVEYKESSFAGDASSGENFSVSTSEVNLLSSVGEQAPALIGKRPTKISQKGPVSSVIFLDRNQKIAYILGSGEIIRSNLSGTASEVIDRVNLKNNKIIEVQWTSDKKFFVFKTKEGLYGWHELESSKTGYYSEGVKSILVSPHSSEQIIYIFSNKFGISSLALADLKASKWEIINDMGRAEIGNMELFWPLPDLIAISNFLDRRNGGGYLDVRSIKNASSAPELSAKRWSNIIDSWYRLETSWSPDGKRFIYATLKEDFSPDVMLLVKLFDSKRRRVQFIAHPKKCGWASGSKEVYCAASAGLLRSRPDIPASRHPRIGRLPENQDTFWRLDIEKGLVEEVYIPEVGEAFYDAKNLVVSPNEDYLLFINKNDGLLYSLPLNQKIKDQK